jgi:hypothetical protein
MASTIVNDKGRLLQRSWKGISFEAPRLAIISVGVCQLQPFTAAVRADPNGISVASETAENGGRVGRGS